MISIVIPNYNGEKLLKKNLPKVFSSLDRIETEVIVVDDCSEDGSIGFLKNIAKGEVKQKVKVLRNLKNLGFSSAVNRGVSVAKGDVVVLLNTDVYPKEDFLKYIVPHFKDHQVFAVACMDKSIENGKTVLRGRGIGKWSKGFLIHSRGEVDRTNTLWASGGSSAFRRSLWNKLGGLDEIYNPFYWEDIDLSYRALKSGYKIIFESRSIVFHEHSKGVIKKTYSDFKIKTIAYRNQFIFAWKNGTDLVLQLNQFIFLPYHFIKGLLNKDWPFFMGFLKALSIYPKIVKSSLVSQKSFVKKDSEAIKEFTQ